MHPSRLPVVNEPTKSQLADALTRVESIIDSLRHPLLVLDAGLRVVRANQAFYRLFEATNGETDNVPIYALGDGQWDLPALRRQLEELRVHGRGFRDLIVDGVFPSVGRRIIQVGGNRIASLTAGDSESDLILLTLEDVTERVRLEEKGRVSEQRYRRLFNSVNDGILMVDPETAVILDANPFLSQLLGYRWDQLVGKELWQVGLFEDPRASGAAMTELRCKRHIRYHELPLETADGRRDDVEFVSNVYDEGDQQVIQCQVRAVPGRRTAESMVRKQVADLSESSRWKDEFLAMVSHELRGPLGAVRNSLEALRLQPDENPAQALARAAIERQVNQLSRLVDDLVEISRANTEQIRLHRQPIDARVVVERGTETVRWLFNQRRQQVSVALPDVPVLVDGDPMRLEQVLVNLLTNAAKYTGEGGRIWVTAGTDGTGLVIRVRDTGAGIAANLLPRIFDLFTQADGSADQGQGGLGVGLTVVRRLVHLHGGTVDAHSDGVGRGSEFVVRLPLSILPRGAGPPAGAEPGPDPGRSLRVLVVDDDEDTADSLSMLLRMTGRTVQTSFSGGEALDLATAFRPEVVLLDLGLPGMNGFDVARRLRARFDFGEMLLIAVTGYGRASDRERCRLAGFDFHLLKPVDWPLFTHLLDAVAPGNGNGRARTRHGTILPGIMALYTAEG